RLHSVQGFEHRGVGVALYGAEAFHAVDDVLRGELSPVHRRLGLPAHTSAELEDVCGLVRLTPRLGQVTLDREGAGHHRGADLVLHEPAVCERVHDVGLVRHLEIRIEMRWIPEPKGDRATTLGGLGADAHGRECCAHEAYGSDAKEIATFHVRSPCR